MKTPTSSSVAVSLGSRRPKRITLSLLRNEPATSASPSTSKAFASTEPISEACATSVSPAERAKRTTKNSGRFPSVDCSTPVTAGPKRSPTCSVANDTVQASPASASAATEKASSAGTPE